MLAAVLLAAATLSPATLRAAPGDAAAAERLFKEGKRAALRGEDDLACAKFAESEALDHAVGTLLNLADCERARGELAASLRHFTDAAAELVAKRDRRVKFTRERIEDLTRRVPTLTLRLDAAAPAGAHVRRDGEDVPQEDLGASIPLNPGEHTVDVEAPGLPPRHYRVVLAEGDRKELTVSPEEAPPPPAAPVATPAEVPADSAQTTWGWVALSAGALGLSAGAVTGVLALGSKSALDEGCAPQRGGGERACPPALEGELDDYRFTRIFSYVSFGVGVLGTGTGIVLLATSPPSATSARAGVQVTARVAPGFVEVRGLF